MLNMATRCPGLPLYATRKEGWIMDYKMNTMRRDQKPLENVDGETVVCNIKRMPKVPKGRLKVTF